MYKVAYNSCFGGFSLSKEAVRLAKSKASQDSPWHEVDEKHGYIDCHDGEEIPRHDSILIEVIEELGENASGFCANIRVEIINTPVYRIDEYDGNESVVTQDDYDWIIIED